MRPVISKESLSSNHTVIAFDSRGLGNTTTGSKPYTYQQLANDAAGLLDALKIPKADVMGYSLGSYIAQQIAYELVVFLEFIKKQSSEAVINFNLATIFLISKNNY